MPERALALEARAAFDVQPQDPRVGIGGRRVLGLEEPNSATCGRPSAAATCIRPESLLTTTAAPAIRTIASSSVVLPARSLPGMPRRGSRSSARAEHHAGSERFGQLGEVGPALGRAVFRAGAEHGIAPSMPKRALRAISSADHLRRGCGSGARSRPARRA
jgi:hypothetical protein